MGSGYKDFSPGDVLAANDVDGYLMRQTVMTFADAAARDTALSGVLDEGMLAYLENSDEFTFYDGSAWVALLGEYQTFTPNWLTGVTEGNGTTTAWYVRQGDVVHFELEFRLGSTSAITTAVTLEWPVAAHDDVLAVTNILCQAHDSDQMADVPGRARNDGGIGLNTMDISFTNTSGTYADLHQMNTTIPFTWTNGDTIKVSGTYRAS